MRRLRIAALTTATTLVAMGSLTGTALADHHLVKIKEFYPGMVATADDAFLELQMYSAGQNQLGGHHIQIFPSGNGAAVPNYTLAAMPVANSESQRRALAGGAAVVGTDYPEDFEADINPLGGAICFVSSGVFGTIDCVEWGMGNTNVSADPPVLPGGIPDGSSVTRSIAAGCSNLLEAGDDTDNSAANFSQTAPTPENNAAPIETTCTGGGGGGGGGGAALPSGAFTLGGVQGKTLTLNVTAAGTAQVTDAGASASGSGAAAAATKLLKTSTAIGGPGTITVPLKLNKKGKAKLRLKGKVSVNAKITFTPNGGAATTQTSKLKIKK